MLPDRVSNPGPLTYESGALPIALRGPALYRNNVSYNTSRTDGVVSDKVSETNSHSITSVSHECPLLFYPISLRKTKIVYKFGLS